MRSYVNVQSRTTVDNIGDPIYYTVPETVVRGSHHYLPRHDTEYKLVPDGVSLTSPETASESRPLPNFPMLSLDPSKFPNDASCGGTLVAPPNDQSTDTVPPPPTGLSLSAGNGQVSLSLTGGSGTITDYQYRYRVSGGSWSSWISAGLVTLFDVLGLTNGTTYEFEVRAMNGQQASAAIASSFGVTPATPPGAPTNLIDSSVDDGQVTLSWTVPSDTGDSPISHYEYQYRENNTDSWVDWISTDSTGTTITGTTVDVTGLTNSTTYEFQVRAVNDTGQQSSESNTLTATPLLPPPPIVVRPPTAPTDLSASYGDGQISLSWTAPSSSGSSTITHYEYRYATGRSSNHSAFTDWESTDSTDTSYVVTGLTNGTQHLLQVRAVNSERASSASNTAFQTPLAPASAPIWSDIPGPYNLTVGDSFSLDLNSYVTGSPTITKTLGTIPAGLSLSGGVVSGTVTTVEDRSIQFAATNSAGYALSEWVNIVVQAAQ